MEKKITQKRCSYYLTDCNKQYPVAGGKTLTQSQPQITPGFIQSLIAFKFTKDNKPHNERTIFKCPSIQLVSISDF